MRKIQTILTDWGVILSSHEKCARGKPDNLMGGFREYMVTLRTMERMGAKRSDNFPTGKAGEALIEKEISKSHAEWDEYERMSAMFAPHIDQYRRIRFPNPQDDFHAAWVKAGEA